MCLLLMEAMGSSPLLLPQRPWLWVLGTCGIEPCPLWLRWSISIWTGQLESRLTPSWGRWLKAGGMASTQQWEELGLVLPPPSQMQPWESLSLGFPSCQFRVSVILHVVKKTE